MSGKRSATTELNHDNWNEENEPEDAGMFVLASNDVLEKRVIKTAKRRLPSKEVRIHSNCFESQLYLFFIAMLRFRVLQKVHSEHLLVSKPLLRQVCLLLVF